MKRYLAGVPHDAEQVPWAMVGYATYADRLGWTPQQVDQLTLEQDEWIVPILQAVDAQRAYAQRKAQESAERAAKAGSPSR